MSIKDSGILLLRLEDINNPDSEEKAEWKDTKNFLRLKPSTTNKNQFGGFCPPHQKRGLYAPSFQVSSLNYKKFRTVPGLLEGNPQR